MLVPRHRIDCMETACGVEEEDAGYTRQNRVHPAPRTSDGRGDHLLMSEAHDAHLQCRANCGGKQHARRKIRFGAEKKNERCTKVDRGEGVKKRTTSGGKEWLDNGDRRVRCGRTTGRRT